MSGLRDAIEAAMGGGSAAAEEMAPAGEVEISTATKGAGQGERDQQPEAARADGRDEKGRFAAKEANREGEAKPEQRIDDATKPDLGKPGEEKAAGGQEQARTHPAPPAHWKDTAKLQWNKLPLAVKEELLTAGSGAAFEPVLAPHRERLQRAGLSEVQAVQYLLAADQALNRDPRGTILALAKAYGVELSLPGTMGTTPAAQDEAEYIDPQVKALQDKFTALEGRLAHQVTAQETQAREQVGRQVAAFRDSHEHYDIVAPQMAKLISAGLASDLQSAYEQACWANPTVRAALRQAEGDAEARRRADEEAQRLKAAKSASGSVTGSPGGRAAPGGLMDGSLRDVITAALQTSRV